MRAGLVQLTVTDDPAANLPVTLGHIRQAVAGGAGFVLTPELTNGLSSSRAHQRLVFRHEEDDPTLAALRDEAKAKLGDRFDLKEFHRVLLLGSMPLTVLERQVAARTARAVGA